MVSARLEKRTRFWVKALMGILVLTAVPAFAEIFQWVDDHGTQFYTTDPENIPDQYRSRAQSLSLPPSPSPPPQLPALPPPRKITSLSFRPGSPILVSAKINGAGPIPLILDTGADRTLITSWAQQKLGLPAENSIPVLLRGVTGESRGTAVWVDSVEIGEARVGPILITIHDSDLKGADGLLGRDFLAHFNVSIDSKEGIVTLDPHHK